MPRLSALAFSMGTYRLVTGGSQIPPFDSQSLTEVYFNSGLFKIPDDGSALD